MDEGARERLDRIAAAVAGMLLLGLGLLTLGGLLFGLAAGSIMKGVDGLSFPEAMVAGFGLAGALVAAGVLSFRQGLRRPTLGPSPEASSGQREA